LLPGFEPGTKMKSHMHSKKQEGKKQQSVAFNARNDLEKKQSFETTEGTVNE
jgi:hypothetical protein